MPARPPLSPSEGLGAPGPRDAAAALRVLSHELTRAVGTGSPGDAALHEFARDANKVLGARRTTIWLYDRRARELVQAASSDPHRLPGFRVPDGGPDPAARGRGLVLPEFLETPGGRVLVVPLRGRRRALGTVTVEGADSVDEAALRATSAEMGRDLSVALENLQLLDELLSQRRLLEDAFDSLADFLIVTDSALRVVQVNEALRQRTGRSREAIYDRPLSAFVGPQVAAWVAASVGSPAAEAGGTPSRSHATRTFADLPIEGTFLATVTPLLSRGGEMTGHVLVLRDVTLQTRLEAERESLRAQLSRSEKLAALGQFVAGVAHEMNNPLQGLLGHLELLISHTDAARPLRRDLRRIHREGERAARIVRNLLVFTGTQRMARRRLRLERVIARALASRRAALARARIDVVRRFGESVPAIVGDPLLLQQAFLNILINAEHAIRERDAPGRIEVSTTTDGLGRAVAAIRDTGPGIAPEALPRIFDPFFTTREAGRGSGLGLAVTYGIVHEHGGTIHAANSEHGGALFTITLPGAR